MGTPPTAAPPATTAAPPASTTNAEQIIHKLLHLIENITRTTGDGRRVPYCEGNCSLPMTVDLCDAGDFSILRTAEQHLQAKTLSNLREATAKGRVRQRVADIIAGACGHQHDAEDTLTVEDLGRVIPALQSSWPNLPVWCWFPHNLGKFLSLDSTTDWLVEAGAE